MKAVESEEKQDQPMTIERACKNGSVPEEESSGAVTKHRLAGSAGGKASGVARATEKLVKVGYRVSHLYTRKQKL